MRGLPGFPLSGRGSGAPGRKQGFFGIALEGDLRGQITGQSPGVYEHPTTDDYIIDDVYEVGTFLKGANWELYKTAAVARGADPADFEETGTTVRPKASAVEPFMSLFDIVQINPHQNGGITPIHIKTVKDLRLSSSGPKGRRFLANRLPHYLFHPYKDDMPAGPHTSTLWAHYYNGMKAAGLFMRGVSAGSTGSWMCDPEETESWPGGLVKDLFAVPPTETPFGEVSGHNWHVDYTKKHFARTMADLCLEQYLTYWNASGGAGESIDGYIPMDLCPVYPARTGSATNLPTIADADWTAATTMIPLVHEATFRDIHPTLWRLWSATGNWPGRIWPGHDNIQTLGGLFNDYQWSDTNGTVDEFIADVGRAAAMEVPIMFGNDLTHASLQELFETPDHPDWWTMLAGARRHGWEENTYLVCRGAGTAVGYLYWTPAMRPIV